MLSLDVQVPQDLFVKAHRSYFVWDYGKPPDVVIEVVSNGEGKEDGSKLADYARIGVEYSVIFDPEQHLGRPPVRAHELHGSGYGAMAHAWFGGLGHGLRPWDGPYEGTPATWLRWHILKRRPRSDRGPSVRTREGSGANRPRTCPGIVKHGWRLDEPPWDDGETRLHASRHRGRRSMRPTIIALAERRK